MASNEEKTVSEIVDDYFAHILFIHNMLDDEFDAYMESEYPTVTAPTDEEMEAEYQAQESAESRRNGYGAEIGSRDWITPDFA